MGELSEQKRARLPASKFGLPEKARTTDANAKEGPESGPSFDRRALVPSPS